MVEKRAMLANITRAEEQLLTMLRGEDVDNFQLAITYSDGRFSINLSMLEPPCAGFGKGAIFDEAWDSITPRWAIGPKP